MWFGGDVASIAGSCACPGGMALGKEDLRCKRPRSVGDTGNPGIWLVIGSLLGGIVLIGIFGLACFFACKVCSKSIRADFVPK